MINLILNALTKSRRLNYFFRFTIFFLSLFIVARLAFTIVFFKLSKNALFLDILKAFQIGTQFDIRLAMLCFFPVFFISLIPFFNITCNRYLKALNSIYLWLLSMVLILVYAVDFGYFSYVNHRLSADIINLMANALISLKMVLETYPVFRISIGVVLIMFLISYALRWIQEPLTWQKEKIVWPIKTLVLCLMFFIYIFAIWQSIAKYGLRWDKAFFTNNTYIHAVALNPVLFFINTYAYQEKEYSLKEFQKWQPVMKDYLARNDHERNLLYNFPEKNAPPKKVKNIIIIHLETFPAVRLKLHNNKYNPAPFINELASKSIYFENMYSPMWNTGEAFFSLISSVTDFGSISRSSTRNPYTINQHSIINQFLGYEKYFFIGGSASWANIRGFLKNNIEGIHIYDEEKWDVPSENTWGISDYDLFNEIHSILSKKDSGKPFFGIVLTGSNHRPYSIAKNAKGFEIDYETSEDDIKAMGFISREEYNALRLLDFNVKHFIQKAIKQGYGKETIFCIFSDHGTVTAPMNFVSQAYQNLDLNEHHVPLFFYEYNKQDQAKKIDTVATLRDVMPMLANLAGVSYVNKTLGRDLFKRQVEEKNNMVVLKNHKQGKGSFKVVGKEFVLTMDNQSNDIRFFNIKSNNKRLEDQKDKYKSLVQQYQNIGTAIYQTSKYFLYHEDR